MTTKPIKVFTACDVRAAIWENSIVRNDVEVTVYSIQISRTYKDGEQFKDTSRFNLNDLSKVQLVAKLAYEYLVLKDRNSGASSAAA